jgi:hypothetical protein
MGDLKSITTRRVIRPGSTSVTQVQPPGPALAPKTGMWQGWQQRFAEAERVAASRDAQDRALWAGLPQRPDPVLGRQVQANLLQPWIALLETFDLASTGIEMAGPVRAAYLSYLHLRVAYYEAVVKRCLAPGPASIAALEQAGSRLDAARPPRSP